MNNNLTEFIKLNFNNKGHTILETEDDISCIWGCYKGKSFTGSLKTDLVGEMGLSSLPKFVCLMFFKSHKARLTVVFLCHSLMGLAV